MVEFPPYIKILPGNAPRRANGSSGKGSSQAKVAMLSEAARSADGRAGVVSLVSRENRSAALSQVPTAEEAAEALRRLREDLPELGQAVDVLHSNLDRRRILDLLAPLMEV